MMINISPKEVTTHFVYLVTNLLRKERGLHGIDRDGSHRGFYEGGLASH